MTMREEEEGEIESNSYDRRISFGICRVTRDPRMKELYLPC